VAGNPSGVVGWSCWRHGGQGISAPPVAAALKRTKWCGRTGMAFLGFLKEIGYVSLPCNQFFFSDKQSIGAALETVFLDESWCSGSRPGL